MPSEVDDNVFTFIISGKEIDHAKTASGRDELVKTITSITDRKDIEFGKLVWISNYRYVMLTRCHFLCKIHGVA